MNRLTGCFLLIALGACDASLGGTGGGGGVEERLVLGGRMSFEQCQARGGLIIRDANTAMIACDPRVIRRQQAPSDTEEFGRNPTG
ncbi:hypothetical protein AADZ90_012070 [Aestuariibius sp. 2305UL40-4]|uniref:hypothetical protein n=1 Tax=Aestuariibius violaceus TaxID=3234132 RepID=UPI00345F0A8E